MSFSIKDAVQNTLLRLRKSSNTKSTLKKIKKLTFIDNFYPISLKSKPSIPENSFLKILLRK